MSEKRVFCRFTRDQQGEVLGMHEVPQGGMCLSAFLVLTKRRGEVLMGKVNPQADWAKIGALDSKRLNWFKDGWMLPSSHLILYESPQDAAKRIAREQLGLEDIKLDQLKVVSEVYDNPRFPDRKNHWDIEFIFTGSLERELQSFPDVWTELRFVDLNKEPRSSIVRSHDDIIQYSGAFSF
ncbi:MAG: NUDIX domain-containing protein [Conexivisphaerales archaeon]